MKRLGFLFFIFGLLSSRLGSATSFEYIGADTRSQLERDFREAHAPTAQALRKKWSCDMYGMRTHLQVKRGMVLYEFSNASSDASSELTNLGRHNVRAYRLTQDGALGETEKLTDTIKITSQGKLIARLYAKMEGREPLLVAYSTCE